MASTQSPAILSENPKLEGESWEKWGERLSEKYKTPAATPNLPLVPGHEKLRTFSPILLFSPTSSDSLIFPCSRELV